MMQYEPEHAKSEFRKESNNQQVLYNTPSFYVCKTKSNKTEWFGRSTLTKRVSFATQTKRHPSCNGLVHQWTE